MNSEAVVVHGLDNLQAQLEGLSKGLADKVLAKAARKAFRPVLETAKQLVAVDTGLTRDSIRMKLVRLGPTSVAVGLLLVPQDGARKSQTKGLRGSVRKAALRKSSAAWRWHFIELGTAFQDAQPFLRPALDSNAREVTELLRTELQAEINRITERRSK